VLVAEANRVRDRIGVERVQLERHSLADQRLGLLVEADRVATRHLLDQADDLHVGETKCADLAAPTKEAGRALPARPSNAPSLKAESVLS
jgi:hypothetical protein